MWHVEKLEPKSMSNVYAVITLKRVTKRYTGVLYFTFNELQADKLTDPLFSPHFIVNEQEKQHLESKFDVNMLAKVFVDDFAARMLNARVGDILRIHRRGLNGEKALTPAYRIVT
jgi:DNA-directed RNA polymerase subunit H (RpoH/RPB5)